MPTRWRINGSLPKSMEVAFLSYLTKFMGIYRHKNSVIGIFEKSIWIFFMINHCSSLPKSIEVAFLWYLTISYVFLDPKIIDTFEESIWAFFYHQPFQNYKMLWSFFCTIMILYYRSINYFTDRGHFCKIIFDNQTWWGRSESIPLRNTIMDCGVRKKEKHYGISGCKTEVENKWLIY